jgi:hypothetical protein
MLPILFMLFDGFSPSSTPDPPPDPPREAAYVVVSGSSSVQVTEGVTIEVH